MDSIIDVENVQVGFHPDGYRIDRTASAMNRYTKWDIAPSNHWSNPRPVCFHSLPTSGWIAVDKFFDWTEQAENGDFPE
ncbi:MAG: hypothetical protein AB7F23_01170 [Phycisphaerae bacterium]|jgi:hypothetical protein